MLLPIKRVYLTSGDEREVLLGINYIMKIEAVDDPTKPKTRIIVDQLVSGDRASILYTNESLSTIKGKLTRMRK